MNTKLLPQKIGIATLSIITLIICVVCACAPPNQAKADENMMGMNSFLPSSNPSAPTNLVLSSETPGQVDISWDAWTPYGVSEQTYTIIYTCSANVTGLSIMNSPTRFCAIKNLPEGEMLFVQIRTNARYGDTTLYSSWTPIQPIAIAKSAESENIENTPDPNTSSEPPQSPSEQSTTPNTENNNDEQHSSSNNSMLGTDTNTSGVYDGPGRGEENNAPDQNNGSESSQSEPTIGYGTVEPTYENSAAGVDDNSGSNDNSGSSMLNPQSTDPDNNNQNNEQNTNSEPATQPESEPEPEPAIVEPSTPKPNSVSSITLTSPSAGVINVSWKAPDKVDGTYDQAYQVRYSTHEDMSGADSINTIKTSVKLTRLNQGEPIYVQVRTTAQAGIESVYSDWSDIKTTNITTAQPPQTLSSVALTSTVAGQIKVSWDKAVIDNNFTNQAYQIRYSYNSDMSGATTVSTTNTTETINSLTEGRAVYVQVRISAKCGSTDIYSDWSTTKSVNVMKTPTPNAVSSVTLSSTTPGQVKASWQAPSVASNLTNQTYDIRWSYNSDMSSASLSNTSDVNKTFTSLTEGKTVYVQVRSAARYGATNVYSAWSATKSIAVMKTPTPKAVTGVTLTSANPGELKVNWTKPATTSGLTSQAYEVRWSYNSDMSSATIATTSDASKTFTSLTEGKTVYAQVRTTAKYGTTSVYSAWSAAQSITIKKKPTPSIVSGLTLTSTTPLQVSATWTKTATTSGLTDQIYQIRWSYNSDMSSATTVNANTNSATLTALTEDKVVYVQARTRAKYNGEYVYSAWSATKNVTVKKMPRPKAATNLALTSTTPLQVGVTWTKAGSTSGLTDQIYQIRYSYNSDMSEATSVNSSGASTTFTGLEEGKTLYVQIRTRAKYDSNYVYTSWSTAQSTTVKKMPRPKAVTNVALTSTTIGQVGVTWTAPSTVSGLTGQSYQVRWSYNSDMSSATTVAASSAKATLSSLTEGKVVYVQVRTKAQYNSTNVYSAWSATQSITVKKKPTPKVVSNVSLTSSTIGQVKVTWTAPAAVSGLTGQAYQVRWSYNSDMSSATTVSASSANTTLTGLTEGKLVYIQVRTTAKYNTSTTVYSSWSAAQSITVKKKPTPNAVTNAKVTSPDVGEIKVTWTAATAVSGLTGQSYEVKYSYNSDMSSATTVDASGTSKTINKLTSGNKIYVQVRTKAKYSSTNMYSAWSSVVNTTISGSSNGGGGTSITTQSYDEEEDNPIWVPEQGHWEDEYITVIDQEAYTTYTTVYYTQDGWSTTDRTAARVHLAQVGGHLGWENIPEYHPAITHKEKTGKQIWVVDVPGHWE